MPGLKEEKKNTIAHRCPGALGNVGGPVAACDHVHTISVSLGADFY